MDLKPFKCFKCGKVLFRFMGKVMISIFCHHCGAENRAGIGAREK